MERYLLRDDIWWVGAIDWDVRDFHGYETPRGTTYNAYLILDEKVALIDGCRDGFGPEMLARVTGLLRRPAGGLSGHQSRGARSLRSHSLAGRAV